MSYPQRAILYGIAYLTACYLITITIDRIIDGPIMKRYWRIANGSKR